MNKATVSPRLSRFWAFHLLFGAKGLTEINALSDFNVEIEPIREGGRQRAKVTGYRLAWDQKPEDEWRARLAARFGMPRVVPAAR